MSDAPKLVAYVIFYFPFRSENIRGKKKEYYLEMIF